MAYEVFGRNIHHTFTCSISIWCENWQKSTNGFWYFYKIQETESKKESQFYLTWKIFITYFVVKKTAVIFFSDFHWHDLGYLAKILIFLDILAKMIAKILARNLRNQRSWHEMKKSKILARNSRLSKILARNLRNPRSWQEMHRIQDLGKKWKKSNILTRNSRLSKIIQDYPRYWQENQDAKHWDSIVEVCYSRYWNHTAIFKKHCKIWNFLTQITKAPSKNTNFQELSEVICGRIKTCDVLRNMLRIQVQRHIGRQ